MSIRKLAGASNYISYRPRRTKSKFCGFFSSITSDEPGTQPGDIKEILHGMRQEKHPLHCLWILSELCFFSA
jgi:hypothetical protein